MQCYIGEEKNNFTTKRVLSLWYNEIDHDGSIEHYFFPSDEAFKLIISM